MSEGKTVFAEFDTKDKTNRCSLHGCQRKISANETYFKIMANMGYVTKHIRICKKCLVSITQTYLSMHPEYKHEVLEESFGGSE